MNKIDEFKKQYNKADYDSTGTEGENCFSIIMKYLDLPSHGKIDKDYTHENMNSKWNQNDKKTVQDMIEQYSDYVDRIPKNKMRFGDILICKDSAGVLCPMIFAGNDKVLTMTKYGIYVMKLFQFEIVEVFRKVE